MMTETNIKSKVMSIVQTILPGQLTTYGTISKLSGVNPRVVGWTLSGLNESEMRDLPWQRVVAKDGVISSLKLGMRGNLQIDLLHKEGHQVKEGRVVNFQDDLLPSLLEKSELSEHSIF